MHFTLKQLRYYDAAIRSGSIARASAEMNISQSSITAALDILEQTVGQELFRRVPAKGIQPTEAGKLVGQRIDAFLEHARVFESELMSLSGIPKGRLHVGCYSPSAPYVLPRLMRKLAHLHPSIRVELVEADLSQMHSLLQEGKIDLALTYRRTVPEALHFLPLFEARPYALLPENSPLAGHASVSLQELRERPMVLLDLPDASDYFTDLFAEQGLVFQTVHTTKSSSVLRGLVAAGFGHSVLNICGPGDRDGSNGYLVRPISGAVMTPVFGVAYTAAARRSTLMRAVLDVFEELANGASFNDLVLTPQAS